MMKPIATFSIVAYDPAKKEWGIAVQSKFMAVGAVVCWAKAGAGAVATQSYANLAYGPDGLELMASGKSAQETIDALIKDDAESSLRQVGMVDRSGVSANFTGNKCMDWAGGITGSGYTCQGNILIPGTVEAMSECFEERRRGDGELADWLVDVLEAGQKAGGDRRGRQAAAVMVVRDGGGYGGNNDRYLDLRVDDHPEPIKELKKLVNMHHIFFGETDPNDLIAINTVAKDLQVLLKKTGYYEGPINGDFDDITRQALIDLVGTENLEERWNGEGIEIDKIVVDYLLDRFKNHKSL
jgi:uncharacterized Ntn-hydrolase superfamily protein